MTVSNLVPDQLVSYSIEPDSNSPSDIFSITDDELKDRLHFIREIGYGNWGSVWSCYTKDTPTRQKVAVKLVHRSKTPTTTARVRSLWNEMKIHRAFKHDTHPSIVSFYSFIITPSFALISIPANILLTASCVPVLVDFGFAEYYPPHKYSKEKAFLSNLAYGTPEYLSPERAKGYIHDTRLSDIYSLGVTFFEILIGRTPFEEVEGEVFETHQDLQRYWERTKKGLWLGQQDWAHRMSNGVKKLLQRMMCPDAEGRPNAAVALDDPYWCDEEDANDVEDAPVVTSSAVLPSSPPPSSSTPVLRSETPTRLPAPVPPPSSAKKTPKPAKIKKARSTGRQLEQQTPSSQTVASPASRLPRPTSPLSPRAISPIDTRAGISCIPVPKRRPAGTPSSKAAGNPDSDKENTAAARPKSQASSRNATASAFNPNFHLPRKTAPRKPIPASLHTNDSSATVGMEEQNDNAAMNRDRTTSISRLGVPSIANKSAVIGYAQGRARKKSAVGNISRSALQKQLAEQPPQPPMPSTPLLFNNYSTSTLDIDSRSAILQKAVGGDLVSSIKEEKGGRTEANGSASKASTKVGEPKSVLDVVREMKASMRERERLRQQVEEPAPGESTAVDDTDMSSIVVLDTPDTPIDSDGLPIDALPRGNRESTAAVTMFKQSLRMSLDKLGKMSSAMTGPGNAAKQSRVSLLDVRRSSLDETDEASREARSPTPFEMVDHSFESNAVRPPQEEDVDRMTAWIRNVERAVEETRSNFQNGKLTPPRLPSLPPRMIHPSASKRALNKVHPVLMVDSPTTGRRRRATVGAGMAMESAAASAVVTALGLRSSTGDLLVSDLERESPVKFRSQSTLPLGRIGHISPVANLEEELSKAPPVRPLRLSAVIDPREFSVQLPVNTGKDDTPSVASFATTSAKDTVNTVRGGDVMVLDGLTTPTPPLSPSSSLTTAHRRSASSVMLMGPASRLAMRSTDVLSSSTLDIGVPSVVEGPVLPAEGRPLSPAISVNGVIVGREIELVRRALGKSDASVRDKRSVGALGTASRVQSRQGSVMLLPDIAATPRASSRPPKTQQSEASLGRLGHKSSEPLRIPETPKKKKVGMKSFEELHAVDRKEADMEKKSSVTSRVRKVIKDILSTPKKGRTNLVVR
ncbi:hypothetical protein FRB99_005368 [Tulasnella sp. 403]|nr:hypothetical protein FRB99_005368 [Tulasnella sp. 403]